MVLQNTIVFFFCHEVSGCIIKNSVLNVMVL
jgi:hypothetical protein